MPFVKDQHPRLFFGPEDLPALREKARHGMRANATAFIRKWADRLLDPADKFFFDYATMQQEFWKHRSCLFRWRSSLNFLTWAYVLTGDQRYGQAARDALMATIERKIADIHFPAEGPTHNGWRRSPMHQHDKGNYATTICTVFDCCYDLFTPAQREVFYDHALEGMNIFLDPLVQYNDRVFQFNNRGARALTGCLGYYRLILEGNRAGVPAPLISAAERYLFKAWDVDGYPLEGWSYGGVLAEIYMFFVAVARAGHVDLRHMDIFHRCLQCMVYETLPWGSTVNNLNDAEVVCGGAMPFIGTMSRPEGALVPWLFQKVDLHPERDGIYDDDLVEAYYRSPWIQVALFWDDKVPVKSPVELGYPLSRCVPEAGVASMRTGWEKDDLLLVHRAGPSIPLLHSQSDNNHLALYALGERFLVDEGYGERLTNWPAEVPKPEPARYFGQSQLHNTVIINGESQNGSLTNPRVARGRFIDWAHTDSYDTTLGDAHAAYTANGVIHEAMRRVILVRAVPHPFIFVIDTVTVDSAAARGLASAPSHNYEVLWRTELGNQITVAGDHFTIQGRTNDCHGQILFTSTPAALAVRTHVLLPQLRVQITAPRLEIVTALCPLRRGESAPQFTCQRQADGDFRIEIQDGSAHRTLTAGTHIAGPLRQPRPIHITNTVPRALQTV